MRWFGVITVSLCSSDKCVRGRELTHFSISTLTVLSSSKFNFQFRFTYYFFQTVFYNTHYSFIKSLHQGELLKINSHCILLNRIKLRISTALNVFKLSLVIWLGFPRRAKHRHSAKINELLLKSDVNSICTARVAATFNQQKITFK